MGEWEEGCWGGVRGGEGFCDGGAGEGREGGQGQEEADVGAKGGPAFHVPLSTVPCSCPSFHVSCFHVPLFMSLSSRPYFCSCPSCHFLQSLSGRSTRWSSQSSRRLLLLRASCCAHRPAVPAGPAWPADLGAASAQQQQQRRAPASCLEQCWQRHQVGGGRGLFCGVCCRRGGGCFSRPGGGGKLCVAKWEEEKRQGDMSYGRVRCLRRVVCLGGACKFTGCSCQGTRKVGCGESLAAVLLLLLLLVQGLCWASRSGVLRQSRMMTQVD